MDGNVLSLTACGGEGRGGSGGNGRIVSLTIDSRVYGLANQTQPTPARLTFSITHHLHDTESNPHWGWC